MLKAFYEVLRYCKKKGISSYELGKEIGISQPTEGLLHCKLQQVMQSSGKHPLTGEVHFDEYVTGGPEAGKPVRSDSKKKKTLIIVKVRDDNKTGRVYCQKISNYKKEMLYPIIESTVSCQAAVVTMSNRVTISSKRSFQKLSKEKAIKEKLFR